MSTYSFHSDQVLSEAGTAQSVKLLGYGLDIRWIIVQFQVRVQRFCSPKRFWDPSGLLCNGYRGLFRRVWSRWDVKLTTHLHVVLRIRMSWAISLLRHMPSWRVTRTTLLLQVLQSTSQTLSSSEYPGSFYAIRRRKNRHMSKLRRRIFASHWLQCGLRLKLLWG
jgi:hypothetical protein